MPSEIKIRGEHGIFQVDGVNACASIVAWGDFSGLPNANLGTDNNIIAKALTYTGAEFPLFGLYLEDTGWDAGGVFSTNKSGNTWTVYFCFERNLDAHWSVPAPIARWFVFDRAKIFSGTGPLAELRNDYSQITFSSKYPPKAPIRSAVAGRKYALVGGTIQYERQLDVEYLTTGAWAWQERKIFNGFYSVTGGGVASRGFTYYYNSGSGTGGGGTSTSYSVSNMPLAFDVTGYV